MKYIDIHAHLDFSDFDADRDAIIADMQSQNIGHFNVGTCLETSLNSIALAEAHDHIHAIVGIHPLNTHESKLEDLDTIEPLISHPKCVAIGECGFDFFHEAHDENTRVRQLSFFKKQIELAIKYNKPLMIHCRNAYPETLEVLTSYKSSHPTLHAHFHFFTEPIETAQKILDLGFTLSFTGPITFADYDELIKFVPLESLMVETDSPYASPKSHRGQRNDPRNVVEVITKIAEIKGLSLEEVTKQVRENMKRVFGI